MNLKKTRILIVDDHKMIRDGIKAMLESQTDKYKFLISECESGEDAIQKITDMDFDIVLMDYQLPAMNGADTVAEMCHYKPNIKILAISNYDEHTYITNIMKSGAKGYVLKNIGPEELILAITTILSGKSYYANDVAVKLINFEQSYFKINHHISDYGVTKRELEILRMVAQEMTNDQIAKKLSIAKRTVDSHRQNLLNKLRVKNTAGLVKCAYELNIIP